ncbi:ribonucleoside-triphosphate reductase [Tepidibacillus fermentans]|uniref:Uncharacterized protein n=1 Tax=Tepidibacillus fermentans TaxID=1281767 RepID=A0A4R3K4I7_9BACI|nr:ribonucleoside-triphosphate reductase [Tepidibacillus fermentans]TCS77597.1 hypothetical protein EDD72_1371 [Tepidibacillus fermentans]
MSIKILLEDWERDWEETLRSEEFYSFFSCEMYMRIDNGTEQMVINVATIYGTALLSIADGIINMIVHKENKPFRISGFGSMYEYFFTPKDNNIKIEAVNVTNDVVEFSLLYDKMKFSRDFVRALKNHLRQISYINPLIREHDTYKLLEQKLNIISGIIEKV